MASEPTQSAPAASDGDPRQQPAGASGERAIFTLSRPLKRPFNGSDSDGRQIGMRALDTPDLDLLDRFRGQPIALLQNAVAILCGVAVEQVQGMPLPDFTMLASDALWQIEQASSAMGLPLHFFLLPPDRPGQEPGQ